MTDHTELIDRLRDFALHLEPAADLYANEIGALDEAAIALTAADASIAELTRERDEARDSYQRAHQRAADNLRLANAAEAALAASQAEVERLREGLRPFARIMQEKLKDYQDGTPNEGPADDKQAWGFNDIDLRWGDFRRARTLTADEPPQEQPK